MDPNSPQNPKLPKKTKLNARNLQTMAGDIGHAFSLERFGPKLSERVIWRVETQKPQIALTFDDGPHVSSTPMILEILEKQQIPATFFWVGKHITANKETALSVLNAGHEVGNHTFTHTPLVLLSDKQVKLELVKTDKLLKDLGVSDPKYLRPPSGFFNKRVIDVAEELGYRLVVGDVYPRDSHRPGSLRITQRVLERTTNGSIIILHDGGNVGKVDRSQTHEALLTLIPELQKRGFEFVQTFHAALNTEGLTRFGMMDSDAKIHETTQVSLKKVLGVPDGIAILIGICIGAGIYSNPQLIAGYLSSFHTIILLWLGVGVFVFISGLVYAELGTRMPHTGGEYMYITRCFGPYAGFMFGWGQLFIVRTSAAAGLSLIVADYIGYFVPLQGSSRILTALGVIFLFGALNYVGIQRASIFQKFSTILKVAGLLFIIAAGFLFKGGQENLLSSSAPPTGDLGPVGNLVAALMLIIFAHTGWERIGYSAGEMKNPKRVIPSSLLIGISAVVCLYALTNVTFHRVLGIAGMRESTIVATDVLTVLIGPMGAAIITILVIISASGSINGTMMTAPRVYFAMARDGLFFKWLDYVHPRFRTPSRAIAVHCIWAGAILIIRGTFEAIALGLVFTILIFYAISTLALFKMRKENIGEGDIFRVPLYPVLPWLSFVLIVVLLVMRAIFEWQRSAVDLIFIVTGIPFALYWCREKVR